MNNRKVVAVLLAIFAAVFYALSMPLSKLLLGQVPPAFLASFLYLGAGIGMGIIYAPGIKSHIKNEKSLSRNDLPYVIGMILLDIAAPILLMVGLVSATSSSAALLNNFEIVATSLIALIVFKERVSLRLWLAILLITIASMLLSIEDLARFKLSYGSLLVLAAAVCWGFENNMTRKLSSKSTYQIVILKGLFSGLGSLIVALILGEQFPQAQYIAYALLLGFVAYGISIFLYVKAQRDLGAAKTSAYYAIAPFVGALLSFMILREALTENYATALLIMLAGSALVVADTLLMRHTHVHTHTFIRTIDGVEHTYIVEHSHDHRHFISEVQHAHSHKEKVK